MNKPTVPLPTDESALPKHREISQPIKITKEDEITGVRHHNFVHDVTHVESHRVIVT